MSYFGAVKAHRQVPWSRVYDSTGEAYHDPGNAFYAYVLRHVWPGCLPGMTSVSTLGDVMEAFLAFGWFMGHPENLQRSHPANMQALQVYESLHKVLAFVYYHWHSRDWVTMWLW